MKRSILITLQAAFILFGFYLFAFAEDSAGLVNKANSLYGQKKYDAAIKLYNAAQIKSPDSAQISYNIGIAQYKKGDYDSAISFLEKATSSQDKLLESKASFNIANAKYKLGKLKENTELKETVNLLRQSLDYYKRAIELNFKDEDARINHELVEKELKILLDKLKQEQDKQKEQSGQEKKEEQQGEQKQGSGEGEQKAADAQKAGEAQKQEEAKEEKQAQQAVEQKESQGQESQAQAQQEESKEMSKREANQLLEGYRQEENSAGKLDDRRRGTTGDVLKDW